MINMMMSQEDRDEYQDTVMAKQPLYPYGLCIQLDDETIKKLGITKLPEIDEVIEFCCKAQVVSLHSRKESNDEDESSVCLQITDMEIVQEDESDDPDRMARKLYGDMK